jgi:hypothetical protein
MFHLVSPTAPPGPRGPRPRPDVQRRVQWHGAQTYRWKRRHPGPGGMQIQIIDTNAGTNQDSTLPRTEVTGPGRRSRFGRPSTWPEPASLLRRRGRPAFGAVGTRGGRGSGERVWDARRFSMPETSPSAPLLRALAQRRHLSCHEGPPLCEMILVVTHPGRASCSDWQSPHCGMPE